MAFSFRMTVLLVTTSSRAWGVRISHRNQDWPDKFMQHCIVDDVENICWQGKMGEGRLHAICAGELESGKCSSSGYPCDVSGVGWERYTWFLGLKVFEPKDKEVCIPYLNTRNLHKDVMMTALQKNGFCAPVLEAVRGLKDQGLERTMQFGENFFETLLSCKTTTQDECADLLTGFVTDDLGDTILAPLTESKPWRDLQRVSEWAEEYLKVEGMVDQIGAGEAHEKIPDEVVQYAEKFHLILSNKNGATMVAKRIFKDWARTSRFVTVQLREQYLDAIVKPAIESLLKKFPDFIDTVEQEIVARDKDEAGERRHDKAADFVTDAMKQVKDFLDEKVSGILGHVGGLCEKERPLEDVEVVGRVIEGVEGALERVDEALP